MARRTALFLAACALALGIPWAASPASAHTDACAGAGLGSVGTPHGYLAAGAPSTTTSMAVNIVFGGCATTFTETLFAEISGWCETTTGHGVTSSGHTFTLTGSLYSFVLAGQVTGNVTLYSGTLDAPCEPEINNTYRATSALVLNH